MMESGGVARVRAAARDRLDEAARYARERRVDGMRADLVAQVRRHPLAAIAAAFLAGYLTRRIL